MKRARQILIQREMIKNEPAYRQGRRHVSPIKDKI